MNRQDIIDKLRSKNEHLNKVTEQYLLSHLDKPILGNRNFEDIEYFVEFGLNEYRINNYQENRYDYERKTMSELCEQFNISTEAYEIFKQNINGILKTYIYKSWQRARDALKNQIKARCFKIKPQDALSRHASQTHL